MAKLFAFALSAILFISTIAAGDTIFLKNGSILKGKVTKFDGEQFVVTLALGSDRNLSRATIHKDDVASIEFDPSSTSAGPASNPERESGPIREQVTREAAPTDSQAPRDPKPTPRAEPERSNPVTEPVSEPPKETEPTTPTEPNRMPARKPSGQVQTTVVDVAAKRDWTSTGLIVRRGETIRISATGSVVLDPVSGQTSGPEGTEQPDSRKLMPDKPTGALIAVIGADNDDFIYIGRSAEFLATRDGLLFLSVNEGTLSDNSGSYKATIERQTQRSPGR